MANSYLMIGAGVRGDEIFLKQNSIKKNSSGKKMFVKKNKN